VPTVVIGTAGHIDHGKTTLLRALTGIDADRLPEERERGMTIDVGFAHLVLEDGSALDFVDVPGHDRLVGNMLVGAGEIDGVLLVVAADDGPRAQTLEHLELLDALGLRRAVVAVTKADVAGSERVGAVAAAARELIDRTSMAGAVVVPVSGVTGAGLDELRRALISMRDQLLADAVDAGAALMEPLRLAVDRAFTVKGRGAVVTGTLRGGSVAAGDLLRIAPGGATARVREVQVHHAHTDRADGGRTALNVAGVEMDALGRGVVLTAGVGVEVSDRLLVALMRGTHLHSGGAASAWPPKPAAVARLHIWTETADATVRPVGGRWTALGEGRLAAILRLSKPIAVAGGAHAVLRDPGSGRLVGGVTVLEARPPRGVSRRRVTPDRLIALDVAVSAASSGGAAGGRESVAAGLTDLHGALASTSLVLAEDVSSALTAAALELAAAGPTLAEIRSALLRTLRRLATIERSATALATEAVDRIVANLLASGEIVRDGDRVPLATSDVGAAELDARSAALERLEAALDVDAPPPLAEAALKAGVLPEGIVALERGGRIVRVEDDLAWTASRYASLRARALEMARAAPLPPAAFRDAIGGNRRIALALLEDLGRKGLLRRTDAGHVPGPRSSSVGPT